MKGLEGSKLGRYELRFRVAQGGMSEVYLGYDRKVQRYVAVKVLYGNNKPFVQRFEREALAVGTLAHDHILPLYDFGEQHPWYYLVMPFVESGTLRDYLVKQERLTLEEAGSFLEQIASALQYAHDHGIIHRDVKPSNILLRPDGHAYLTDFGLAQARLTTEYNTANTSTMIGTPEYMAPEQSNGENDHRSDIYSLGIILYQMLTGHVPFRADSPVGVTFKHLQSPPTPPTQWNTAIPESIEHIILKALAKDPSERFQEATIFANAYRKALVKKHTSGLEEDIRALGSTEQNESIKIAQKAEETIAAIEQLTPRLTLPSSRPLLLTEEQKSASYTDKKSHKRRIVPYQMAILCLLAITCIAIPLHTFWQNTTYEQMEPTKRIQSDTKTLSTTPVDIQATLAAQARVQTSTKIDTSINRGTILYQNSMNSEGGGWIDDGKQCYFTPQGYHVTIKNPHAIAWCYSNQELFTNMTIAVQASLVYGDFYGVVFRLNPYRKTFYAFELNAQGEYRVQQATGDNPSHWLPLIDWTPHEAIHKGYQQTNTLLIIAIKNDFRFYINQQFVVSTSSNTPYLSGMIGLLTGGDSPTGTEAIFNNIKVIQQ